jgi:hypothetical protein
VQPDLQQKFSQHRSLAIFVDRVSELCFSRTILSAQASNLRWSHRAGNTRGSTENQFTKQKTEQQLQLERKGRIWLACAAAIITAYVLLSGQYLEISFAPDSYDDDEGDDMD